MEIVKGSIYRQYMYIVGKYIIHLCKL